MVQKTYLAYKVLLPVTFHPVQEEMGEVVNQIVILALSSGQNLVILPTHPNHKNQQSILENQNMSNVDKIYTVLVNADDDDDVVIAVKNETDIYVYEEGISKLLKCKVLESKNVMLVASETKHVEWRNPENHDILMLNLKGEKF